MNVYSVFPLIATLAFIPLLVSTLSSRPWHRRHTLFILFLIPAMLWNLLDYFFRANSFPDYYVIIWKVTVMMFPVMTVQFHLFASSFFLPRYGRWLPFAYGSLAIMIILAASGYLLEGVTPDGDKFYPVYGYGVIVIAIPLLVLAVRSFYIFSKMLNIIDNPVTRNQVIAMMISIVVLTIFTSIHLLPWGREFPISHYGNLINAFVLSFAVIRHKLVDIRIVIRQGMAWFGLGIIGTAVFWSLLMILRALFGFKMDLMASLAAAGASCVVAVFVYRLRNDFFGFIGRVFQGSTYHYRRRLAEFTGSIHNVFSLKEQGGELLSLLTPAIGIKQACLLFPESGNGAYITQFAESDDGNTELTRLRLAENHPIIKYLEREQTTLTRESLTIMPEFLGLWSLELEELNVKDIEMFMPLISREHLIAILVLGTKRHGRYSLEDHRILEDITHKVAVSMEKEYLREQLWERDEELSVINRSSAIITSSFDIQEIYDSFVEELKKVVDVSWAAIVLVEGDNLCFQALCSEMENERQVGEKVPVEGSGTQWAVCHKRTVVEPDLSVESRFSAGKELCKQGLRSVVYLPLIAKGEGIGSLIVASFQPYAYSERNIALLEQLAAQIAMPVENSRLYAQAEERARVDELTGLLNRRSLDEMIDAEINRHSRYGGIFSLAILDLDSFKLFNDNYGHLAGDKLLKQTGRIIRDAVRSSDQAFRYGGDEFAILLPHTTVDAASLIVERVRQRIATGVEAKDVGVTASIGLASWPADGVGQADIIAAADGALYSAKRCGGNQSHYASGGLLPGTSPKSFTGSDTDNRALSTLYSLAEIVEKGGKFPRDHSRKVTEFARSLAETIAMTPEDIDRLEASALLHDIGMIGVHQDILLKETPLTEAEAREIEAHVRLGAAIVSRVPQLVPCVPAILHHHERYDGGGYPEGLSGEAIPLGARILAIAHAFAALTFENNLPPPLGEVKALEEIKSGAGKQFDPGLVEKFLSIYGKDLVIAKKNT